MNNFTFLFLVFFLFHGSAKGFDYGKITQTWQPSFCHESPCIPGKRKPNEVHYSWSMSSTNSIPQPGNCRNQILPHVRFVFKFLNIK